ncbi:MAG: helix-turn-helix transcriptional regulator [Clostridia bacterium]|nr:helix-turn-helix transcriptional regulator [Clostridia bacterium]
MPMAKKIKHLLLELDLTITELAERLGTKPQNITNKLKRDNFSENELQDIARVLNCEYEAKFIIKDEDGNILKEI